MLACLCLLTLVFGVLKGASVPFWSDELATLHIAAAPSWAAMLQRAQHVDLNPPLMASLVRVSIGVFGAHELGARLPSILSFTVAVAALFLLLSRRVSLLFAAFGALLLLANVEVAYYLTEARPYALLLGAVMTGLWAYDAILSGRHLLAARIVLFLAMLAMLQAHLFGSLAALGFVLAEGVRTLRNRHLDRTTAAILLLPWLSCFTYGPILHPVGGNLVLVYREHDRASVARALAFYKNLLLLPFSGVLKIAAVVVVAALLLRVRRGRFAPGTSPAVWVVLAVLAACPLLITAAFLVHSPGSGFYPRYAIAAVVPFLVLLPEFLAWITGNRPLAGILLVCAALGLFVKSQKDVGWHLRGIRQSGLLSAPPGYDSTAAVEGVCPALPLVINNALDFFEADYRLGPDREHRMVYVTDPAQALRLEHESIGESVSSMAEAFHLAHKVVPAVDFFRENTSFLVLSRPVGNDWFLDSLSERPDTRDPLGSVRFAGKTDVLWYVSTIPGAPLPACALR